MTTADWPVSDADLGVLERGDGEVTIRFARRLPHPPGKVWRALTEAGHLAAWFPTTVEGDLAVGAALEFSFREVAIPPMTGTMLAFDPPRVLLGCALAGEAAPQSSDDRWRQVIGTYQARFGPDASVAAPPPEWEDAYGPV
jgi:uncharacterized protein YndB with AHSA1/START domain